MIPLATTKTTESTAAAEAHDQLHDQLLRDAILDDEGFVEAVFQGARRGQKIIWARVTIRPVLVREARHLQFSYFDDTQDVTKNVRGPEAEARLAELLRSPFKSIRASTTGETIRVQFGKKGRPIVHRERRERAVPLDLTHDRAKPAILSEEHSAIFLHAIGVMTGDRVRADQKRKFRQINEFLRLIEETGEIERLDERPVRMVDLGCGSAALTFAAYHYLNEIKGIPATMIGVDAKAFLMERHRETAARLGWEGMTFRAERIIEFEASDAPHVVLALHACDTATDEALARAVRWRSKLIFSAPCCHHHLQTQLAASETPESFRPVLRHGILRERQGDILTDAFRALILRLAGYRADVLEFVAIEHTPKNLMIRAVHQPTPAPTAFVAEYRAMKEYWGVTPYLETLLRDELQPILTAP
jgi:SAM-dependent methyltransferase